MAARSGRLVPLRTLMEMTMRTLRTLFLAAVAALSFSTAAYAGGGHHGGHDDHYDVYDPDDYDDHHHHDDYDDYSHYDDEERWIDVYNDARDDVFYVYMRHRDTRRWGPDLLGQDIIATGDTLRVEPVRDDGYCIFTMRVEFEDGDVLTSEPFNACTATDAVVTNRRIIVH